MSVADIRELQDMIRGGLAPAIQFLSSDAHTRDPIAIPEYLFILQTLLDCLAALREAVPDRVWQQLAFEVLSARDMLSELERTLVACRGQPPPPPQLTWQVTRSGQLKIVVDPQLLATLSSLDMSDAEIARYLGCSTKTLYRSRKEQGITKKGFTELDDVELDTVSIRFHI